jgi:hypothetical protein
MSHTAARLSDNRNVRWLGLGLAIVIGLALPTDSLGARTRLVKDINPSGDSLPGSVVSCRCALFFAAETPTHGRELWRSDGTRAARGWSGKFAEVATLATRTLGASPALAASFSSARAMARTGTNSGRTGRDATPRPGRRGFGVEGERAPLDEGGAERLGKVSRRTSSG